MEGVSISLSVQAAYFELLTVHALSRSNKNLSQYLGTRFLLGVLGIFPLAIRRRIARSLLRFTARFLGRHRNIACRNIALAFPDMTPEERTNLFVESFCSLGDLIIDLARFPTMSKAWAVEKIQAPGLKRLNEVKDADPEKGILFVAGHLGSFELSAYCLPYLYRPIAFLARTFTNPYLESWWKALRESNGNSVVARDGGYKEMVKLLRQGTDVGVLFDQNVTRNHALFVDWFGKPAATTKALALAALRTKAPIFMIALIQTDADQYYYEIIECDCADIYENRILSTSKKLIQITERLVTQYEGLIRTYPQSWFWMHRRWKTSPEGEPEDFYQDC